MKAAALGLRARKRSPSQTCALESATAAGQSATREVLERLKRISRETNHTPLKLKPRLFG
jgi:hypothetical protein